jgi:dipeptidyl aminopeptidase/acylaminoacyl peptidase
MNSFSFFLGLRNDRKFKPKSIEHKRAGEASPVTHITPDDPPFLLIHGDKDETVPFENSELMAKTFELAGVPFKLVRVKGAGHGPSFKGAVNPPDFDKERVQWMDTHLCKE